jgi:hypothetical protein
VAAFAFTLRISQRLADEAQMDAIYSHCPDCSLLVEGGVTLLRFQREAASLARAMQTAIADVNAAGFHVDHVELEPDSVTTQTA